VQHFNFASSRAHLMTLKAEIMIDGIDDSIFRAVQPEQFNSVSEAKVYQSNGKLILKIDASEVSDLKAAVNSWLRLIKMCLEVKEVLDDG